MSRTGTNPGGRPKGRGISTYIRDLLEVQDPVTNQPKAKLIALRMVEMALDPETPRKDFIQLCSEMMDRLEGKAVATNINAELGTNPFDGIPTDKLEQLRLKLESLAIEKDKPKE